MSEEALGVLCAPASDGWRCTVTVGDDPAATRHEVSVDRETLGHLAPGADPQTLVRESFRFLLERESRGSIMRSFALPIIGRFFSEYEEEVQRRMSGTATGDESG